ncbi:MAG: hypothetical protein KF819_20385 [Labilithrix sp.]|nr:hypothetical protein [Labilithrix sp.]
MAEALFRAAKELQAEGKLAEACVKYMESHHVDPKPGTILNVATCHEQEGKTATAWADYAEAATFAARAKQADREKFARAKIEELEKKLSYVTLHFPADLAILLDGKALATASGTRVPLDPGDHTLEATAPGKIAWRSPLKVEAGPSEQSVTVPALEDAAAPIVAPPAARDGSTERALGWVTIGVGVAALGAGTIFGVQTLNEKSTVDANCVGVRCNAIGLKANDDAHRAATLSTVGFVLGTVALATGIVLLVTAPHAPNTALLLAPAGGAIECVW